MYVVRVRAAVVVLAAGLLAGCSPGGEKLYPVSGKVTFEGEPVKEGRVTFKVGGPAGKAYSAEIRDGAYTVHVAPGQAVVEITASRPTGRFDTSNPGVKEPIGEMYIPAKYNAATMLKAEVHPQSNDVPFDLRK